MASNKKLLDAIAKAVAKKSTKEVEKGEPCNHNIFFKIEKPRTGKFDKFKYIG
jgi:hypothetical protein